jgi:4-diphosphocytidyl-2-C-methyl-D-erythritol kinase
MSMHGEAAKAKLNLTLRVSGRRSDGYHEIESLVAFAALGDELRFEPGDGFQLAVEGPFAGGLSGPNLIATAAHAAKALAPDIRLGAFTLRKTLPVAAGLGGGSADAAAALRLLARANPTLLDIQALRALAAGIGSDVTVCLDSAPALMTGRGEMVDPVEGLPSCGVVLANPDVRLATADVYAALQAPLAATNAPSSAPLDFGGSFEELIAYASPRGNDLEAAALRLAPVIGTVLDELARLDGARLVRLSGSGPTCFALFASADEAERAAAITQSRHEDWWIAATALGGSRENRAG